MISILPPLLADLVAAHNAHDSSAFISCFAADAVVRDEGRTHFGLSDIRAWFESISQKYQMVIHVTDLTTEDGEPILHGEVSGTFPNSPIAVRYFLGIEDGKVVALKIVA